MIPYSDRWRLHRRLFHQSFRPRAAIQYHPVQLQKARELIVDLLATPQNFIAHLQTHSAAIIMSIIYGYETARWDDPIVSVVNRAIDICVAAVRPEVAAFLGFLPFLRYIPAWFPWRIFQTNCVAISKIRPMKWSKPLSNLSSRGW
ncbi:hypothetical protein JVU11DRAFT_4492 [Chiua virens]|nr:hypothetical protein JVU11DRAFT_4492 [Chiua virens]